MLKATGLHHKSGDAVFPSLCNSNGMTCMTSVLPQFTRVGSRDWVGGGGGTGAQGAEVLLPIPSPLASGPALSQSCYFLRMPLLLIVPSRLCLPDSRLAISFSVPLSPFFPSLFPSPSAFSLPSPSLTSLIWSLCLFDLRPSLPGVSPFPPRPRAPLCPRAPLPVRARPPLPSPRPSSCAPRLPSPPRSRSR